MSEKQPQPQPHSHHDTHKDGHGHGPEKVKEKHGVNTAEHHKDGDGHHHSHPETAGERDDKIAKVKKELVKTADDHHSSEGHPVSAKKESTHNESKEKGVLTTPKDYFNACIDNPEKSAIVGTTSSAALFLGSNALWNLGGTLFSTLGFISGAGAIIFGIGGLLGLFAWLGKKLGVKSGAGFRLVNSFLGIKDDKSKSKDTAHH